jgi:transposase
MAEEAQIGWRDQEGAAVKKYIVTLTDDERAGLTEMARTGKAAAYKITHARILLKADAAPGGPAWDDQRIADALDVGTATVERLRRRFVEDGLDAALARKKQARRKAPVLDGAAEARLVALACSAPPEGRSCWTLRLLAGRLVELEVVPAVSYETVRRTLQKTTSSRG